MSPKMFIPISITLTETEYLIVQDLARQLGLEEKQISGAIRLIIREWRERKQAGITISPESEPGRKGESS